MAVQGLRISSRIGAQPQEGDVDGRPYALQSKRPVGAIADVDGRRKAHVTLFRAAAIVVFVERGVILWPAGREILIFDALGIPEVVVAVPWSDVHHRNDHALAV